MTIHTRYNPKSAWIMTALLTGLAMINFLDKIVIGMVAVPLTAELHLSPAEFGFVAGSFFWLFSVSTIVVGFLANRFPTRWILLAMGVSWAVLQLPQAFAGSAVALLACRVVLGAAEGPSFPTSVHAIFKWFPDRHRNVPVAIINQGAAMGMILAGLAIPLITKHWGWRTNFFLLAAIGVVWCVLWLCFGREGTLDGAPRAASAVAASEAEAVDVPDAQRQPYFRLLTDRSILCVFLLCFAAYWLLGQTITWLPTWFEKGLGYGGVAAGRCFALVILAISIGNIGLSWLSQRMLNGGASSRQARVQLICVAMIAAALLLIALAMVDLSAAAKVVLYAVASALPAVCLSVTPALLAEMVPTAQRASMVAINTAVASLGAAISPAVMGRIVQVYGSGTSHAYEIGFAVGAALMIGVSLCALRWLHPARAQHTLKGSAAAVTA
ncbi:putative sulfoacetate transporter SauU [Paraburkholderia caffeinitolerans]|uniref:Putative sulfoacetate transporter SauU n=1 Tax=Paraburkholderia caffeinitolerans TaxID=1723730 RepID=A0A6J5FCH6_9BURK|nr:MULTISPECIES: MFS transporter [Paraburkholderia]CAB3777454.1 putative sulfoacetate transporter SauU [Paraburkholderia caffeinitolerans]